MRHDLEAGNSLELLLPPLIGNDQKGTRLIAVPNGKNAKDWIIRHREPKDVMIVYGSGSTIAKAWTGESVSALNEGLRYDLSASES